MKRFLIAAAITAFLMIAGLILIPSIALISRIAGLLVLPCLLLITSSVLFIPVTFIALIGVLVIFSPALFAILALVLTLAVLALLSILSQELFRVLVPPELLEIAKRIALLSRDAVRVINGLSHIPLDVMRAIAVLDDPVLINYEAKNESRKLNILLSYGKYGWWRDNLGCFPAVHSDRSCNSLAETKVPGWCEAQAHTEARARPQFKDIVETFF